MAPCGSRFGMMQQSVLKAWSPRFLEIPISLEKQYNHGIFFMVPLWQVGPGLNAISDLSSNHSSHCKSHDTAVAEWQPLSFHHWKWVDAGINGRSLHNFVLWILGAIDLNAFNDKLKLSRFSTKQAFESLFEVKCLQDSGILLSHTMEPNSRSSSNMLLHFMSANLIFHRCEWMPSPDIL